MDRISPHARLMSIPEPAEQDENIVVALLAFLRRNWLLLAGCTAGGIVLGLVYWNVSQPLYTASSSLLIENNRVDLFQRPSIFSDPVTDNSYVESQIEVIKSNTVAREVKRVLGITTIAEMSPPQKPGLFAPVGRWIGALKTRFFPAAPKEDADPGAPVYEDEVTAALAGAVTIRRVGLTTAVDISATAATPDLAQKIADAVPTAYLNVDRDARIQNSQKAVTWLEERLSELRQKLAEADQAVEAFKRDRSLQANGAVPINSQLRALESSASGYKTLYDSMQARYLQEVQEQSFIRNRGWLISPAGTPRKSWPRGSIALAAGLMLGLFLGLGVAGVREAMAQRWSVLSRYEAKARVPILATIAPFGRGGILRRALSGVLDWRGARKLPAIRALKEAPFSQFSEEIRRVGITVTRQHPPKLPGAVVGLISLLPSEGKSTIAANLAVSLSAAGHKVILIDLDSRNPSLSRAFRAPLDVQLVTEPIRQNAAMWQDPQAGVDFLPNTHNADLGTRGVGRPELTIISENIAKLRQRYEYVVLDLPPLSLVADADAIAHFVDSFLLVASVDRTDPAQVELALRRFDPSRTQVAGLVLNRLVQPEMSDQKHYYRDYS